MGGSHSRVCEELGLEHCKAVQFGESPTFRRSMPPTSVSLRSVLFFPEGEGDVFLRHVGLSPSYLAL
jgi:hypothetical protein